MKTNSYIFFLTIIYIITFYAHAVKATVTTGSPLLDLPPELIQQIMFYATKPENTTVAGYKKAARTHANFMLTSKTAKNFSDDSEPRFKAYNNHITSLKKTCLDAVTKNTNESSWHEYLTSIEQPKKKKQGLIKKFKNFFKKKK